MQENLLPSMLKQLRWWKILPLEEQCSEEVIEKLAVDLTSFVNSRGTVEEGNTGGSVKIPSTPTSMLLGLVPQLLKKRPMRGPQKLPTLSLNWSALQHEYGASAWAVMRRMGAVDVVAELNGDRVHRLENVTITRFI